ncbi:hypothetical protein FRC11_003978, partial [Ceratobasidium sp. 423]
GFFLMSLWTTRALSISMPTPERNAPSIHPLTSKAETIYTYSEEDLNERVVPPSHIISHDVNRLVRYLHCFDTAREGEIQNMVNHLCLIEEELFVPVPAPSESEQCPSQPKPSEYLRREPRPRNPKNYRLSHPKRRLGYQLSHTYQ